MTEPADAWAAAVTLVGALEGAAVPYAIGGAMAYGLWAIPRATNDVDLNLFLEPSAIDPALDALVAVGVRLDLDRARGESIDGGYFVGWLGSYRVDIFTPSVPFSWEAGRTRVRVRVDGVDAWFLSAEATAVFKLLFFRGKDLVDLERLVAVRGTDLDHAYVRRWIAEMMGEDDPRVVAWDALVAGRSPL